MNTELTISYYDEVTRHTVDLTNAENLEEAIEMMLPVLHSAGFAVSMASDDSGEVVLWDDNEFTEDELYEELKAAEKALYEVPGDYWDKLVDEAAAALEGYEELYDDEEDEFLVGDTVRHLGTGKDAVGYKAVPLKGHTGKIIHIIPAINRILVEWQGWTDGHAMGLDCVSSSSVTNRYWVSPQDIVKA